MKVKLILLTGLFCLSLPVTADHRFVPYLGVDAKQNHIEFNESLGKNLIQKNYYQGNFFGGLKFDECLGLEFGYETTARKTVSTFVLEGSNFFGVSPLIDRYSKTTTRISGPHINLLGFYPIFPQYCLEVFGSLGFAELTFKSKLVYNRVAFGITFPSENDTFSKTKWVPRATLGIQRMINHNLGVRASVTWENTSCFKNIKGAQNTDWYVKPKDSRSVGLGVFYNFW